ncbi:UDP-N-acetylmuramoyl-tripeptide--D-alanyl-D-alanine ligase [Breznakia blatticola]|uniref:UDP-N-acetylmuramoyl-tripeptide--D-alanyl-D-alanine ligase n=1 Tax=Breznakia blatticola TaxID=1754012 RepID=A0A4R7ZCB3_9FIRM|nr:UDP-N-acetylmuramoyl-tripeptide--D-alanyl-D-alanine ligase [Breznakia blatticola]TDW12645.1 UDP-N-acetylmuramoyl-tripeptide--D-alanyl-D-alanine ligase [Breznakia blatticola]
MLIHTIQGIQEMIGGSLQLNGAAADQRVAGVSTDSRIIEQDNIYIAIAGERVDGHTYIDSASKQGAVLAIIDNEAFVTSSIATLLVEDSVKALQDLAKAYRESLDIQVIGITGSNGKTSTKDILAAGLMATYKVTKTLGNQNNEIGVPITLLRASKDTDVIVCEMGVENVGDIAFLNPMVQPTMSILTGVGAAHLATLGSKENVARAKLEIMDDLPNDGLFVYYGDDPFLAKVIDEKQDVPVERIRYGEQDDNQIQLTSFTQKDDMIYFTTSATNATFHIQTIGKHQAINALAAIACLKKLGLRDQQIQAGFDMYEPTGMRNEVVKIDRFTILNDSYKSNPESAQAAIDAFAGIEGAYRVVILGDMLDLEPDEKMYHKQVGAYVANSSFDELIAYGPLSKYYIEQASKIAPNKVYQHMDSHDAIVDYLESLENHSIAVLIKGSRGMQLDKVVDKLRGKYE